MAFDIGETVICSVEVKNDAGVLTDPATSMNVKIDQLTPNFSNKLASTAMTKDSTGKYHYDLQTSGYTVGNYQVIYTATDGTRITLEKDTFIME